MADGYFKKDRAYNTEQDEQHIFLELVHDGCHPKVGSLCTISVTLLNEESLIRGMNDDKEI